MARFEHSDEPEVLAIALIPSPEERKRRERALARLLVITLDMLLSEGHIDLAVRIEVAKEMILQLKRCYPETMNV